MSTANQTGTRTKESPQLSARAFDALAGAGELASQAMSAVGAMASNAASDAGKEADGLAVNAGIEIQGLGESLAKNAPTDWLVGGATQVVARTIQESGQYLEEAKFSGLAKDLAYLIRQNPIPAFFVALGLGLLVASRGRD